MSDITTLECMIVRTYVLLTFEASLAQGLKRRAAYYITQKPSTAIKGYSFYHKTAYKEYCGICSSFEVVCLYLGPETFRIAWESLPEVQ